MIYKYVLKPIFFLFDPEFVHDFMTKMGVILGSNPVTRAMVRAAYDYRGKDISKIVDGIKYRTPFLLSAGFDYNAQLSKILPTIGLGGEEAGSITAKPCKGNPKPRLTRLPDSESIIVNKGLKNDGVDAIITRLKRTSRPKDFVVGISIARTNDSESSSIEEGIEDFAYSFRRLNEEGVGDYYTLNISCPNAFGGESFTDPVLLERLMVKIDSIPCKKPIYVKMPINQPWEKFEKIALVCEKHRVSGLVIGNLNKDYSALKDKKNIPTSYCGGLSGLPTRELSTKLIKQTRERFGKRFTIIGVGGVMSPESAKEKFDAGADLVALITGMIFKGPGLVKTLCNIF